MLPFICMGAPLPKLTHIGDASIASNGSSFNFGSFSIPWAGLVVVVVGRAGSGSSNQEGKSRVSSVSIGGSNGTMVTRTGSNQYTATAIAQREVPAGSINVSVTLTEPNGTNAPLIAVSVYLIAGLDSTAAVASGSRTHVRRSASRSGSVERDDVTLGVVAGIRVGSFRINWTNITKRYERVRTRNNISSVVSSADEIVEATGSRTYTADCGFANGRISLSTASWR